MNPSNLGGIPPPKTLQDRPPDPNPCPVAISASYLESYKKIGSHSEPTKTSNPSSFVIPLGLNSLWDKIQCRNLESVMIAVGWRKKQEMVAVWRLGFWWLCGGRSRRRCLCGGGRRCRRWILMTLNWWLYDGYGFWWLFGNGGRSRRGK